MSPYAIVLPKSALFASGARPVIYGLDAEAPDLPRGGSGPRVMRDAVLPKREQYRYVTFNPVGRHPVDWSHEREWRWPFRGLLKKYEKMLREYGIPGTFSDMPAMDFSRFKLQSAGVIVKKRAEIDLIANDILTLVDRGDIEANQYSFVLSLDSVEEFGDLRDPAAMDEKLASSVLSLKGYFLPNDNVAKKMCDKFWILVQSVEDGAGRCVSGAPACCWIWLLDPSHKLTRALVRAGDIIVSSAGRYLVKPTRFSDDRGWEQRETMVKSLCQRVEAEFNVECCFFSVLNSDDPDGVPFYCEDKLDNQRFYNTSWSK